MADDAELELSKVLTKIVHHIEVGSSPSRFVEKIKSAGLSITDVRVVVGDGDELEHLRAENRKLRTLGLIDWDVFEQCARAKGYKSFAALVEFIDVDAAFLRSCKASNSVPNILMQKLAEADLRGRPPRPSRAKGRAAWKPLWDDTLRAMVHENEQEKAAGRRPKHSWAAIAVRLEQMFKAPFTEDKVRHRAKKLLDEPPEGELRAAAE